MKKTFIAIMSIICLQATAQIKMPAASPTQTISQDFGLGKIEVVYSRPSLKGRSVFSEGSLLAPTGIVWRTGANGATKVTFSDPVTIGDKTLAAGSYGLFTIPGVNEWTIIFNTNSKGWGSFDYKEAEDVLRIKVKPETTSVSAENFTINFDNITAESAYLCLNWAKTMVCVPIKTDIKPTVRKQITDATTGANINPNAYQAAANFFFDIDKDYDKALVYVDKAIAANASAYWLQLLKAKTLKELGDKKGARTAAELCIKLATENKNADYVRSGQDLIKSL
jgi:tetratricopeptide (TPR) repeat protein